MKRYKLRTFLIVVTILPALLGCLFRCVQIDAGMAKGPFGAAFAVRVFSLQARFNSLQSFELVHVVGWISDEGRRIDDLTPRDQPGIGPSDPEFTRERHPWDSRRWQPFVIRSLLHITIGDPYAAIAPATNYVPSPAVFTQAANDLINLPANLSD